MSQIQRTVHPDREREWKYYNLGVPQGCICQGIAIIFVAIGAARFFKQEQAIMSGRARLNGWELWLAVGLLVVVGRSSTYPVTELTPAGARSILLACLPRRCRQGLRHVVKAVWSRVHAVLGPRRSTAAEFVVGTSTQQA